MVGFGPGKGYEITLDGTIKFETPNNYSVRHDFNKTPQNTYFMVTATVEDQYCPEECNPSLPSEIPWQGDIYLELDPSGNEIWSWNTFDYYDLTEYNPYYVETYTGNYEMDWTHSNSVSYDPSTQSVFVSVRNLSRVTKIDYTTKELVWNLGNIDFMNEIYFQDDLNFSQQHSVQVLDNGNLLFFDNHRYLTPELSRCIEVQYDQTNYHAEIVWEHELPPDLFSGSRGECDRLPNGNTLITAGRTGHIVEVTNNNDIVWKLEVENQGLDVTMYRSSRIPNLYPVAFSIKIDELVGDINQSYIEPVNNLINVSINNSGWKEGIFIYSIKDNSNNELISNSIWIDSNTNLSFSIDLSSLPLSTYNLEIYPEHAPNKIQTVLLNLQGYILLGDMNNDDNLNILDIVILANLILDNNDTNSNGDINQDQVQNILDIINLINLILDNS